MTFSINSLLTPSNVLLGADLAYNAIQGWYTKKASENPQMFAKVHNLRDRAFAIDVCSLIGTGMLLFRNLDNRYTLLYPYNPRVPDYANVIMLAYASVPAAAAIVGFVSVYIFNKCYKPKIVLGNANEKSISFNRPERDVVKQVLYVSRIIINIGLIVFSPQGPFLLLSTAFEVYSLIKVTQRKWVEFRKEIDFKMIRDGIFTVADKISVVYSFLMYDVASKLKSKGVNDSDPCTICLDDEKPKNTYFCENHTFHSDCILQMLEKKAEGFGQGFNPTKREVIETKRYSNGVYTGSSYSARYYVNVPKANQPSCPNCRGTPEHNDFVVKVKDADYGWSSSVITYID